MKVTTLNEDIDSLAKTALRIADERKVLLRLVNRGASNNPSNDAAWGRWIAEAEAVLKSLETA